MKKLVLLVSLFMIFGLVGCTGETTSEAAETTTTEVETTTTTEAAFDTSMNIQTYTRDTSSGTREAFFKGIDFSDAVDDNSFLVDTVVEVTGNGTMITGVDGDEYGIGYISLASLADSGLTGLYFNDVEPTEENVLNDTYGLKRPFNYVTRADYTDRETQGEIVEALIAYMGTVDGKIAIKAKSGIVNISDDDPTWDDIKGNYDVCLADNSAVTVKFGGSTSVEGVAKQLTEEFSGKCGGFIADHNHTGSSDGFRRTQGSEADGAEAIDLGFASRAFKDTEVGADGTQGQICWDAVVIVINSANTTLTNITIEDIKKIYDGTYTVWSQLA